MRNMIDKAGILSVCLVIYAFFSSSVYMIVPVILVTIISALNSYFEKPFQKGVGIITFSLLSFFFPDLLYFIPLICYDCFMERQFPVIISLLIPIVVNFHTDSEQALPMLLPLIFVSYIIKYHTVHLERLRGEYINLRDDMVELSRSLEMKNRELMEKQDYEVNLATLNERNRIAREIHDSVGHVMSSSILQVGALMATVQDDEERQRLSDLKNTLTTGMNSIRKSVHDLHDDSINLYYQLEKFVRNFTFCKITLDYDMNEKQPTNVKYAIIAIVRESLSNIIRHSDATFVSLTAREHPGFYQIIVSDNGTDPAYSLEKGMGLNNIRARVESLKGNFNIDTTAGFKVFVSIPKEDDA